MPHRYVTPVSLGALTFLTAGSQGLTLRAAVYSTTAAAGTSTTLAIHRASSVVGGAPVTTTPLDDPAPTELATVVAAPTSATVGGSLGNFALVGPATGVDLLAGSGPIDVAPGTALRFQLGTGAGGFLNLYFEE